MECKFLCSSHLIDFQASFILTIWNVNIFKEFAWDFDKDGFILTIWNVNAVTATLI